MIQRRRGSPTERRVREPAELRDVPVAVVEIPVVVIRLTGEMPVPGQ